jgi:hypothetical protein
MTSQQDAEPMTHNVRYPGADELMAEARRKTGLTDFGPETFKAGLEMLLGSLEREANLTQARADPLLATILQRLTNRLEIEAWLGAHPEIATAPIEGPVCITGLPRTGTTALANIMSLDDGFRSLRSWEQAKPCPPPVLGEDMNDPRRLAAVARNEWLAREHPEMMAMHLFDADATDEDVEILGLEFTAQQLALPIFSYHAWWRELDMRPTFAYHRRVMQLLQSQRPPNLWLFKAPAHNFHLDAMNAAYPQARFVITHRDPAKAVPSAISFISSLIPPGSGLPAQMERFGQLHAEHLRIGVERAMAARDRIGDHRFLDVHHRDFVRDPFGVLGRVYDFLGLEFRPQVREKMERWHAANRSGAHGAHRYTPEQFGLSAAQLHSDYDAYIRRFDVQLES